MSTLAKTIATILVLIALFLILSRSGASVGIINALGQQSIEGIRALQGRG